MQIKNLNFENPLILSPMAGVGDFAFRALCREHGADFSFTEMISVYALLYGSKKTTDMLFCLPQEQPVGVQLFGDENADFASAVKHPSLQKFDWIDLNFGCPAPKVFKGEAGSALLAHPQKISKIINACVLNTQKPVSAKIRIGLNQNNINAVEIAKVCEEAGASAIIVHGRTREQGYGGQVQLEHIAAVKASVKVPVIGNGDVRDEQSYKQMLQTGVDGVSLARAALGKPWIFDVIKGKKPQVDEFEILKQHVKYLRKLYPENFLAKYLRKHFLWYLSSSAPAKLRAQIVGMENVEKVLQAMRGFVKKVDNKSQPAQKQLVAIYCLCYY